MKEKNLVEKYDDNPGAYFGMLVEGWEDKEESLKEDKKYLRNWIEKKVGKQMSNMKPTKLGYKQGRPYYSIDFIDGTSDDYFIDFNKKEIEKCESLKEDKFVSRDKMSKKDKKELDSQKRNTWGNTNPVTRVQPNKKAYDRKRDKKIEDESLEESVLNESSDGWDEDKLEELIELLDRLYDLRYEVTSTIRGAYTNCKTYEELGRYVSELAEGLDSVGTDITLIDEDEEDEEEDLSSYGMESGYYN